MESPTSTRSSVPRLSVAEGVAILGRWGSAVTGRPPEVFLASLSERPGDFAGLLQEFGFAAWPQWLAAAGAMPARAEFARWQADVADRVVCHESASVRLREALAAAGIPAVFLKGAWTRRNLYPRPELRPGSDLDLLVPRAAFAAAVEVVRDLGWRPVSIRPPSFNFEWSFRGPGGLLLDLHWELVPRHRVPWACASALLSAPDDPGVHFWHALAHFAGHKGHVRPVAEVDLYLWTRAGWSRRLPPRSLRRAAALWRLRARAFWELEAFPTLPARWARGLGAYAAERWHPLPEPFAWRRWWLGWWLAPRKRGWFAQLLGIPVAGARPPRIA